ncbi:rho GTPase-activating protein REN1 [Trifolium repens]|nr:rho GTPase-activating protein REN1 [Trifolium repens]
MTNTTAELSQGNNGAAPNNQSGQPEHQNSRGSTNNLIFKSGPLFISSKGIGWTSWKKRWFILTQTSLVFFRSDPNAVPVKGNEVNLTLGGIDLNNSGSVIVKADKKLLTVQFPDGHDGRAFTLKAETADDLYEWKTALEKALAQAPSAANATEQNGIYRKDQTDPIDISLDQLNEKEPTKSTVIGRPILLALEDVDGTPSFLEKALKFLEEHGSRVEGVLRQAADVDDVERRVREYEQGKVEFAPDEDAHVIGDCIKHVLRGLPSSPVPASCCKALLEACRTERSVRVASMRAAINDTFPEPNRRLLQRLLLMMQTVASQKAVNKMSSSAVAACMAPLLLRPLLAGECEIDNDFDVGGDGSVQLLQAAAAANHAQAIVITLLEEYNSIFGEGSVSPDIYTDSEEESGSESEEGTDDDMSYDEEYDDEQDESIHESDEEEDDLVSGESYTETGSEADDYDDKDHDHSHSSSKSSDVSEEIKVDQKSIKSREGSPTQHENIKSSENVKSPKKAANVDQSNKSADTVGEASADLAGMHTSHSPSPSHMKKSATMSNGPAPRHRNTLGRTSARKNLSMESIDYSIEEDDEIERLEAARNELQTQIADEVKANEKFQSKIDERKKDLQERRLQLEQDVAKLHEQLHKEKSSRATLETRAELEELALVEVDLSNLERMVEELGQRLNIKLEHNHGSASDISKPSRQLSNQERKMKHKGDADVAATSQTERSISNKQDKSYLSGGESDTERKPEPNKQLQTSSKRSSSSKGEGAKNTSALTKLTSRLNFLKVGRNQAVNELQNADRGRESSQSSRNQDKGKGSERHQTLQSPKGKHQGSDLPNPEKGVRVIDSSQSLSEKRSSKGKSNQNSEKLKKSDSQPGYRSEGWDQHPTYLERGRSEGHHQNFNVDKGR